MSNVFSDQPADVVPEVVQTDAVPTVKPRRNRRSAKAAGSSFERSMADWLKARLFHGDLDIDRRVKRGVKDRGDLAGVKSINGTTVTIELKNYGGEFHVKKWLDEVEIERGNADERLGVVIAKRRGITDPAAQVVFMDAETFACLLEGGADVYEF